MRHRSLLSACAVLALMSAAPAWAGTAVPAAAPDIQAAAPAAQAAQAGTPFTYETMIDLNRLSDPQVSPDGKWVLYSVQTTDMAANRRTGHIWMRAVDGSGEPRRLAISDGGANNARWGSYVRFYFRSRRSV